MLQRTGRRVVLGAATMQPVNTLDNAMSPRALRPVRPSAMRPPVHIRHNRTVSR